MTFYKIGEVARLLGLTDVQRGVLAIAFRLADENRKAWSPRKRAKTARGITTKIS